MVYAFPPWTLYWSREHFRFLCTGLWWQKWKYRPGSLPIIAGADGSLKEHWAQVLDSAADKLEEFLCPDLRKRSFCSSPLCALCEVEKMEVGYVMSWGSFTLTAFCFHHQSIITRPANSCPIEVLLEHKIEIEAGTLGGKAPYIYIYGYISR